MPNHKSNEKRMRSSAVERERNRAYRSRLRAAIKAVRTATTKTDAAKSYHEAVSLLDKAAATRLIHKRNADRNKSRLAKVLQKLT